MYYRLIMLLIQITTNAFASDILPIEQGLTLAQIYQNDKVHTLVVLADNGQSIEAVDISQLTQKNGSALNTYHQLGDEYITQLVHQYRDNNTKSYDYSQLLSPAGTGDHHIALGFNYRAHADEVDAENQPFLFLKTITATREEPIKTNADTLLDYEVEICVRPLKSIKPGVSLRRLRFGFFLCGDFTDRAMLLRQMNLDDIQSGQGFNAAKSLPGFFPTGPYLVIPKKPDTFLQQVELKLYRNSQLRQHASAQQMTWDINDAIEQIFNKQQQQAATHASVNQWLPKKVLTPNTILLTGTPDGVIMRPPSLWFKAKAGFNYFLNGKINASNVRESVINQYIDALLDKRNFLQPEEKLLLEGRYLGSINVDVAEGL